MSETLEIEREDGAGGAGRYFTKLAGGAEAELTFRVNDGVMFIDSTFTPEAFRGGGVASDLTQRAVDDARRDGLKVKPVCPYVAAWFRRHKDEADLLA